MNQIFFDRARFFLGQNRIAEAEQELRKILAQSPNEVTALSLLAECQLLRKALKESLLTAQQAYSIDPNYYYSIYVFAKAKFFNEQTQEARKLIKQGLSISPTYVDFWLLLGELEYHEENWQTALHATERGLEVEPEHVDLINLRALALIKLNRKQEAAATMDYALQRSPEASYSHSNKGWVSLESNAHQEALIHFQEALRLDPNNYSAKSGLKEAIKSKNFLYRIVLQYFLWMSRLQEKGRWGVVIGAYVLYRIVLYMNKQIPELSWILVPIIAAYILFAYSTWIGQPISNLFLRFHPLGKHALTKDENRGSIAVAIPILMAIVFFVISLLKEEASIFFYLFVLCGLMTIPIAGIFSTYPKSNARKGLILYTAFLALLGFSSLIYPASLILFGIGFIAYQFLANYLIGQENRSMDRYFKPEE